MMPAGPGQAHSGAKVKPIDSLANGQTGCGRSASASGRAFTLIELVLTILIIGIVATALVMSFNTSLKLMGRQKDLRKCVVLAEDVMNEIRSKNYAENPLGPTNFGLEAGETRYPARVTCDDVDDYDGLAGAPTAIEGDILSNYAGFTLRVAIHNLSNNFTSIAPTNATNCYFKRITVVVSNDQVAVSNLSVVGRYD